MDGEVEMVGIDGHVRMLIVCLLRILTHMYMYTTLREMGTRGYYH